MFSLNLRPLTFTDRLALCVVGVPLLIFLSSWVRADDACTDNQEKKDHCVNVGGGVCEYETEPTCKANKNRIIYADNFFCGSGNPSAF